jgi:hypothetical protein
MLFTQEEITQIRFLNYSPTTVRSLIDDDEFAQSLDETFTVIITAIKESIAVEFKEAC